MSIFTLSSYTTFRRPFVVLFDDSSFDDGFVVTLYLAATVFCSAADFLSECLLFDFFRLFSFTVSEDDVGRSIFGMNGFF